MSKKVFLGVGHGGTDPGAVGYIVEKDVNLIMANACKVYLEKHGIEVLMSRTNDSNDSLTDEIRECNNFDPDLAIDIHNNAGGGDGFEVYHSFMKGTGTILAQNIEKEVLKIGQNSRGCKTRKNSKGNADFYGFIREIKCPSVVVEGVFVDNKKDVEIADTKQEQEKFGIAYAKGILLTLGIKEKEEQTKEPEYQVYEVTCNSLNIRTGAGVRYKVISQFKLGNKIAVFEVKNGWGRTDKGWVNLSFTTYNKESYYKACSNGYTSLIDALKSIGVDSSLNYRKQIANKNGILNYNGSSNQNIKLLELLKNGKLIKV